MNGDILLIVLVTSLGWLLVGMGIFVFLSRKYQRSLYEVHHRMQEEHRHFTAKLEHLWENKNAELRRAHEEGYIQAQEKKDLSIQVLPWTEELDSSNFFKNRKSVKIGYKYQLFSQGIPCLEPHTIVVEELTVDKLNEENINRAFHNLELAMENIPNAGNLAVKVLGNGRGLANNLLKLVKKRK